MRSILVITAGTGLPSLADVERDLVGVVFAVLGRTISRALLSEGAGLLPAREARRSCTTGKRRGCIIPCYLQVGSERPSGSFSYMASRLGSRAAFRLLGSRSGQRVSCRRRWYLPGRSSRYGCARRACRGRAEE